MTIMQVVFLAFHIFTQSCIHYSNCAQVFALLNLITCSLVRKWIVYATFSHTQIISQEKVAGKFNWPQSCQEAETVHLNSKQQWQHSWQYCSIWVIGQVWKELKGGQMFRNLYSFETCWDFMEASGEKLNIDSRDWFGVVCGKS